MYSTDTVLIDKETGFALPVERNRTSLDMLLILTEMKLDLNSARKEYYFLILHLNWSCYAVSILTCAKTRKITMIFNYFLKFLLIPKSSFMKLCNFCSISGISTVGSTILTDSCRRRVHMLSILKLKQTLVSIGNPAI